MGLGGWQGVLDTLEMSFYLLRVLSFWGFVVFETESHSLAQASLNYAVQACLRFPGMSLP